MSTVHRMPKICSKFVARSSSSDFIEVTGDSDSECLQAGDQRSAKFGTSESSAKRCLLSVKKLALKMLKKSVLNFFEHRRRTSDNPDRLARCRGERTGQIKAVLAHSSGFHATGSMSRVRCYAFGVC